MSSRTLPDRVSDLLGGAGDAAARLEQALCAVADAFGARTATLHRADEAARLLHLVAQRGLPEPLIPVTRTIPFGKGMAGVCVERREPVTICNLQTDESGVVRPGARQTGVAGAISLPIVAADGRLLGTYGIGKHVEHDYTPEEQALLVECARRMAAVLVEG
jgi:signal transduction protein with GAF and PtsI domain